MTIRNKNLVLIFSLLFVLPSFMMAKSQKHGAELEIQKKDGQIIKGELIAVKQNSLLLLGYESSRDISINIVDVQEIKIVKKSKAGLGIGVGFLAGAIPGVIAGAALDDSFFSDGAAAIMYGGFFGLIGGILGGLSGAAGGSDEIIQIEGRIEYPYDKNEILEKLRKKARIREFK